MRQLTPTQHAALVPDKNIAVTAGAGTGKTLILVERYISILLRGEVDIRDILAITFTNKAATEMLERVEQTLNDLLGQTIDYKKRKRLTYIRDHLSSAHVSTIHSFCARLLREFPLESGNLDPGFGMLSNEETDFLVEESITEEIAALEASDEQWLSLFRLFGSGRIKQMIREGLNHRYEQEQIEKYYTDNSAALLFQQIRSAFLEQIHQQFDTTHIQKIQHTAQELYSAILSENTSGSQRTTARELLKDFCALTDTTELDFWQALFSLTSFFTTRKGTAYKSLQFLGGKKAWTKVEEILVPALSLALEPIGFWREKNIKTVPGVIDLIVLENLNKLNSLIHQIRERFQDKKLKQRVVDYEDLQLMTLQLLERNEEIQQQISRRFRYIMVDEFQDTNQLQWEVISRLAGGRNDCLFIVGDPKQSIYGFRAADVRVFNRVRKNFRNANVNSDHFLSESFRFKSVVNHFINAVFGKILQTSATNPWEVGYEPIETKREDVEGGLVELALLEKENESNIQAVFIAARIRQLLATETCRAGEIAILLRSRTHLSEVEQNLRENEVPFRTIGGMGFYQGQEIYDMYHLICFLINPGDDHALIGLLRSPFADVSDEGLLLLASAGQEKCYWERLQIPETISDLSEDDQEALDIFIRQARNWIERRNRIGYYDLLYDILLTNLYRPIAATDLRSEQILANIDKMIASILDFEKGHFPTIIDLAESLNRLINTYQKEGEAVLDYSEENTVKIMTIHQSKGLEFPLVFVPFLEQQIKSSTPFSTYFDETYGVISKINEEVAMTEQPLVDSTYLYELIKLKRQQKELAELKRLFYVGCTRARDQLILSGTIKKAEIAAETPLGWLMGALDKTPDSLEDGWQQIDQKVKLFVHRTFEVAVDPGQKRKTDTITALDQLEKLALAREETGRPAVFCQTTDRPEKEIFSATQLLTFIENKEQYHQRYHLGFFLDDYEKLGLGVFEDNDALLRGTLVHRMMERFPDNRIDDLFGELDISDDRLIGQLRSELTQLRDKIDSSKAIAPALRAKTFKNEVSILSALGDDFVTGTLDRIYQDENNQWVIVDYKSNKIDETKVAQEVSRYKIQMEIYALLLASLYPSQKTFDVGMYFIYPDELVVQAYTAGQIKLFEEQYRQVINEIKQYYPYTEITLPLPPPPL